MRIKVGWCVCMCVHIASKRCDKQQPSGNRLYMLPFREDGNYGQLEEVMTPGQSDSEATFLQSNVE